jgi:hypothetical protein
VIISGRRPRLPRSYREGRLLALVTGDLRGYRLDRIEAGTAFFHPVDGGPVLEVTERVEKRFLGHFETARFEMRAPAPGLGEARLQARHTGRIKREGVTVLVVAGDSAAVDLARALESDAAFTAAILPLDFTRFDVELSASQCVATVELMGASFVSLALPPMRSYVRLHSDQRLALVASLSALANVIGVGSG